MNFKRSIALLLAVMTALSPVSASAAPRASRALPAPVAPATFPYGTEWYAEQWPESEWDSELDRMVKANITFVRMGEFAWSTMEPSEGKFEFVWLDRAIARAAAKGLKVVIGTPTAGPPAWLLTKYPDTVAVERDGRATTNGWRRDFNVNSPRYRVFAARIASKLAERYGHNPAVIGFQIDNEYGRQSFDPISKAAFQQWMKARYGTLDALNARQFNTYWSQTYSDWNQVHIPGERDQPAMAIDWQRFVSDSFRSYQRAQIDVIRPNIPADKFITTNFVAFFDYFDYSVPAQDLSFVSWDWYFKTPVPEAGESAMLHDIYRGLLGRNTWIMETAPGFANWADRNYLEPPGLLTAKLWQAVGHGADGYAFWTWRPALNGTETGHSSIVDAGGRPFPIYAEVTEAGRQIASAWPALRGSNPVADVGMIHDYPSGWALKKLPQTKDYDPFAVFFSYRRALIPLATGVDVMGNAEDLARYRLVVAPGLHLMSAETAKKLADYVRAGGNLVLGARSGVKNEDLTLWQPGALGPLEDLLGARIDLSQVPSNPLKLVGTLGPATAAIWAERLTPRSTDVQTLLSYDDPGGWFDGKPGVVTRAVGKGRITYVGAGLDDEAMRRVLGWATQQAGIMPAWSDVPDGVELMTRRGPNGTVYVAVNWSQAPQTLVAPRPMRDLTNGGTAVAKATLPRFGVAIWGDK